MENPFKISDNAAFVLNLLIKRLKVKVSSSTIEREVMIHPNYPSMLAYSDCLTSWKIPHEAFQVDKNTFDIKQLDGGFVAHVKTLGGQFIWVDNISDGKITYSDHKQSKVRISQEEFYNIWDGIILFAEKIEESGEENYRSAVVKDLFNFMRVPLLVALFGLIILTLVDYNQSITYYSLLLLKLAGIAVSCALLIHSVNNANPFLQNLCGLGKKNDCNAILKSEAANVTNWLSWSEVGMFYFAGSFFALLTNSQNFNLLAYINLLALPYTIYSISYQIRAKTWCVLCCSVQALLWLEAFNFFAHGYAPFTQLTLTSNNLVLLFVSFLAPIAVWSFLKTFFKKAAELIPTRQQLNRFKYDSDLFQTTLQSQAKYSVDAELKPFTIGNKDADTVITMVSSPICNPCGVAHRTIENWLSLRDDIQLKVVFMTGNHSGDIRTQVAEHISALSITGNTERASEALNAWYARTKNNVEDWKNKYPVENEVSIGDRLEKQKNWCSLVEITFTPTIFVNGHKLPSPYQLEDLQYLLD